MNPSSCHPFCPCRQAAERTGIPHSKLELITELADAAALYCVSISVQVDLEGSLHGL
jgi:hypothetical protein